jgi:hypothetical protein
MSMRAKTLPKVTPNRWWRVVIEWKLESQDTGTRYAYVTKCVEETTAIFAAINCLIVDSTLDVGDTIRVLSCDPHAYQRKHDELEEAL